jgi:hypothetical protein
MKDAFEKYTDELIDFRIQEIIPVEFQFIGVSPYDEMENYLIIKDGIK